VAVEDLRLKRVQMRPLMVIANDPPIDCVRSLGSRLCRALPPNDPTAHAEASRGVLDAGRAAMLDGPLKARALRGPGD
jgi:hypothetical protein